MASVTGHQAIAVASSGFPLQSYLPLCPQRPGPCLRPCSCFFPPPRLVPLPAGVFLSPSLSSSPHLPKYQHPALLATPACVILPPCRRARPLSPSVPPYSPSPALLQQTCLALTAIRPPCLFCLPPLGIRTLKAKTAPHSLSAGCAEQALSEGPVGAETRTGPQQGEGWR